MRRQIRPFTIERKRNGRVVAGAEQPPLLDLTPPEPATANPGSPGWAAAQALFAPQPPAETPADAPGEAAAARRILPSLDEPATPEPQADAEPPRRRGRKPGSRNKPRPPHGPKTIENVMRNLFEFWAREDDGQDDGRDGAETAAAPQSASAPASAPESASAMSDAPPRGASALRRRGRVARGDLPRGERWKARLPTFAR